MTINELNIGNKLQPTRQVWTHENNIAHGKEHNNFDKRAYISKNIGQISNISEYNYNKPLKSSLGTSITFKGFSFSDFSRDFLSIKPIYERVFRLEDKAKLSDCIEIIKEIDPKHLDSFADYIKEFAKNFKNADFHDKYPNSITEVLKTGTKNML
jgi:hypothetical protein